MQEAGINIKIKINRDGFNLGFSGYSD